jgi:hypothetical protein
MISYKTVNKENLALRTDVWTIATDDAKKVKKAIGTILKGSYWYINFVALVNKAARNKQSIITVCTSGFSTSEFARFIDRAGLEYQYQDV